MTGQQTPQAAPQGGSGSVAAEVRFDPAAQGLPPWPGRGDANIEERVQAEVMAAFQRNTVRDLAEIPGIDPRLGRQQTGLGQGVGVPEDYVWRSECCQNFNQC